MKITATIITFNEESNIRAACESVGWADEVLVVDSESTDATRDIASNCGANVIINPWPGFGAQKQFAVDRSGYDWILSLDADERVSPELTNAIAAIKENEQQRADGYLIARRSFYQNRWIRGGGWYPDRQLRLFNRHKGHWSQRHVHEAVVMDPSARVGTLKGDILHYTGQDAAYHHRLIGERYAPLSARQMFEDGRRASMLSIATAAPGAFLRSYVWRAGFRDGLAGLSIASFAAHNAFLKQLMLWELQRLPHRETQVKRL
ncbi:MAG: glycosyltransferase family 2 protein [Pyrinomonadaceae bacterium]